MSENNHKRQNIDGRDIHTKHHRGRKKKRKKVNMIYNIILVVAVGVFVFSGVKLFQIFNEYHKGTETYDKVRDLAITEEEESNEFQVNFDELLKLNKDVIGWIRFEEPSIISYPILQGQDNNEYLRHTIEREYNTCGSIFVDEDNAADFSDRNTIIYGHHMHNGTMFGQLDEYHDKKFWEEHPVFWIYTPDGKVSTYRIFSVATVLETADTYTQFFASDEEWQAYLDKVAAYSDYDTDTMLGVGDTIVTLSTCTKEADEHRFVIHAVKTEEVQQ